MIIDFHAHVVEPSVLNVALNRSVFTGFGALPAPAFGRGSVMKDLTVPEVQVDRLNRLGIDMAVLTASTVLQPSSWAEPATDTELCRRTNDYLASWVARFPRRFVGSFVLPLQDLEASIAEMKRCTEEFGMRVVQLPVHVGGHYLGEQELRPIWREIDRLSLVSFIHPEGIADPWFQKFRMWNSIGQPIEEAKCIASMIYEGLLEELPRLKIVLAHGGGMLPHYMGRMDRNVEHMPETMKNIKKRPSEYLKHFYYDTCLYDAEIAENLIRKVGHDRILLGSDYPVGEADPLGFLDRVESLSPSARERIKGGLAAELLGFAR